MPGDQQPASPGWGITRVPAAGGIAHTPAPRLVGFQDQAVSTSHRGGIKGTAEREAGSEGEKGSGAGRMISSVASICLVVGTEIFGGKITRRKQQVEICMDM